MTFRTQIALDGRWAFQIDPEGRQDLRQVGDWRAIQAPAPWQAQFDDLRHYSGAAWYRRTFTLDSLPGGAAILHFGAVDYHATVWVNGQKAGAHEGGYLPFELDVTALLKAGENELAVYVVDADDDRSRWPDFPFSEVPHGKQSWYGPIGGLWQSVWLELRPARHLTALRLTPSAPRGSIAVEATANGDATGAFRLRVAVADPEGRQVAEQTLDGLRGEVTLEQAQLRLWSPDSPALYTVSATLLVDGEAVDGLQAHCGFRTIEARDGRIYLNGEPIYLRGALDQAYYPETIYTPPSLEFLEDQVRKAKALGLNCLRAHIKIEDPRYYEVADRLGILVWTEIPNWALLTPAAAERAKATFRGMVMRDWNHPSIFAWSLVNEDWGTDLVRNPEHRRWLADFYAEAKQIDPTRLIVDNSACPPNFHVASDLEDYHHYRAIPDHAEEWDQWVADFANRAKWAWAEDYLANRRADLPLIVSEFGNWGLPNPDNIQEQGKDPWWFETGHEWGDGIVYPHGMRERFHFWGLDKIFGSLEEFTAQHQRHMGRSLAYEIGTMRLHPAIGGYVITEFTDVHWECNGLMDMQRNVKQHLEPFVAINQDNVVVVRPQRWSGHPGETVPVEVRAFGVNGPGQRGTVRWHAGGVEGELAAPGGRIEVHLPVGRPSGLLTIEATWADEQGRDLAVGHAEVAWVSAPTPARRLRVLDDPALAQRLAALGYAVVEDEKADLLVARQYNEALQGAVQSGARLLLLAGPETTGFRLPAGFIRPRAGTPWQGDWATSFSWLKKSGPFAHLPGDPLLEMEYAEIMPDAVLAGLPAWVMRTHSWAGLALGWVHKPVSLLAQLPYGQGSVVISTFNLTAETLAENAIAQALLAG
ncbi:MAG TPA: glycoside hydrolase family 2 TIM barrel-domain containing protein, partial [Caldilineaceae bacterium]|nr:glycoside hydrolase family 2 TIM barrel-domain containing protein [Caldilineaceae bacterium]